MLRDEGWRRKRRQRQVRMKLVFSATEGGMCAVTAAGHSAPSLILGSAIVRTVRSGRHWVARLVAQSDVGMCAQSAQRRKRKYGGGAPSEDLITKAAGAGGQQRQAKLAENVALEQMRAPRARQLQA